MTPDQIIWALMLLVVLPSSLFNRAAAITVGVFALGYLAWRFGLPEPQAQLSLYGVMVTTIATHTLRIHQGSVQHPSSGARRSDTCQRNPAVVQIPFRAAR